MRPPARFYLSVLMMVAIVVWAGVPSSALVSSQEAADLKSRLTPVGRERAGNADGTIAAGTGGVPSAPGYGSGAPRPDLFAADKPLFSITARNFHDYEDKLPEGAKALFVKQPGYRMDIYPSHRSAAAPDWVYENIFHNATHAHAAPEGIAYGVDGAAGGIPFPMPRDGFEAMWNHLLAFWGPARELTVSTYIVPSGGAVEKASTYREIADFPYYYRGATADSFGPHYFKTLHLAVAPAARAGEAYLNWQPINIRRNNFVAWRLLPGEHRVRKAPGISYDLPDTAADGFVSLDEYYIFFGRLGRYHF